MIELRHLRKEFEDITPLEDVNVTINSGDVISVIGPSGTGKSTLLRCINMLEPPTSGEIVVDGQVINDGNCDLNEIRKKMGLISNSYFDRIYQNESVLDLVLSGLSGTLGIEDGNITAAHVCKLKRLLERVGLPNKMDDSYSWLSKGERQNILILRASGPGVTDYR